VERIVVQAKERARQGIWVKVYVPGKKKPFAYFQSTDNNGLWARSFRVPRGIVGRAAVTFRLWHGGQSVTTFKRFQVVQRRR
jgi:hypothetical protein